MQGQMPPGYQNMMRMNQGMPMSSNDLRQRAGANNARLHMYVKLGRSLCSSEHPPQGQGPSFELRLTVPKDPSATTAAPHKSPDDDAAAGESWLRGRHEWSAQNPIIGR